MIHETLKSESTFVLIYPDVHLLLVCPQLISGPLHSDLPGHGKPWLHWWQPHCFLIFSVYHRVWHDVELEQCRWRTLISVSHHPVFYLCCCYIVFYLIAIIFTSVNVLVALFLLINSITPIRDPLIIIGWQNMEWVVKPV